MIIPKIKDDPSNRIVIDGVVQGFSHRISSHRSAWAYLLKLQLNEIGFNNVSISPENLSTCDIWIIDHGMEFKGTFNIFGGANDELYHRLMRFLNFPGKIYSMHIDMPDLGNLIESRYKTGSELFKTLDAQAFREKCQKIPKLDHIFESDKFLLGDSHAFSMYTPGYMVSRNDGQTLHGALKKGLLSFFPDNIEIKEARFYFGNIDLRHHLARREKPNDSVIELVERYTNQLITLSKTGLQIEVIQALPIENESRKIPKTGYHNGTAFYGDWTQRNFLRGLFNQYLNIYLKNTEIEVYHHPDIYFNALRELSFDVMEKPKSVHLSREYYRWDFEKNQPNQRLIGPDWQSMAIMHGGGTDLKETVNQTKTVELF
jgi:hypothetical protein